MTASMSYYICIKIKIGVMTSPAMAYCNAVSSSQLAKSNIQKGQSQRRQLALQIGLLGTVGLLSDKLASACRI